MDGQETVGNSLERALLGGNEMEAGTSWTGRKPPEIVWGELHWEGATTPNFIKIRLFRKNCAPKTCQSFQTLGHGTCIGSLAGCEAKRAGLLAKIFQDKFYQCDCPEKLVPKTSQTVSERWAQGHAWEKVLCWSGFHFARRSVRRC